MRLRVAAAMPAKGGRPCVIGVEVKRGVDHRGRRVWHFVVGAVDRVMPSTVEGVADSIRAHVEPVLEHRPCVLVDVASPQGLALRKHLRDERANPWPKELHRPHAYPRDSQGLLFAGFLEAYAAGRVEFRPGLKFRPDLDRALVFYMGGGVAKDGVELEPEDEAMVQALGLAMTWPSHGPDPRRLEGEARAGAPASAT